MSEKSEELYAIYRGDEFIDVGTLDELTHKYHKTKKYIRQLTFPSAHKRRGKKAITVWKVGKDVENS